MLSPRKPHLAGEHFKGGFALNFEAPVFDQFIHATRQKHIAGLNDAITHGGDQCLPHNSPLAKAALGLAANAQIRVTLPAGEAILTVLSIRNPIPAELERLLDAGRDDRSASDGAAVGGEVVIVPDRHGTGTNGLLLTPPDAIEPSFGPDSCERHRALALAAGAACRLERPPSLLLDVDTGADLLALRERLAGAGISAVRTRAVLGQPERPDILAITSTG